MKTTIKQKEFCENLILLMKDNINTWITTNDINSPSHYTLIDESIDISNIKITEEQENKLKQTISDIYDVVKSFKD